MMSIKALTIAVTISVLQSIASKRMPDGNEWTMENLNVRTRAS